jgi:hypothetical protein
MPFRALVSPHARRQARRRGITLAEIEDTYVVDTVDGRVVSAWRKQSES